MSISILAFFENWAFFFGVYIFNWAFQADHIFLSWAFWPEQQKKTEHFFFGDLSTNNHYVQWFEVHFRAMFSSSRESIESWSKLAINQKASRLVVMNYSEWHKSVIGRVFSRVDPLPSGHGGGGGGLDKNLLRCGWKSGSEKHRGMRKSLLDRFGFIKTLMGLEPFESDFFFREKFTKINLALKEVIKNHSKVV